MTRLSVVIAALWWGSLTTLGFMVVPLLFANLPTPALAGGMAAKLFSAQTWASCVCGLLLLMTSSKKMPEVPARVDYFAIIYIASGMLLALLVEFAVAPRIVARDNLKLWHGVGSAMYVLQWVCAGATLWKVAVPSVVSQGSEARIQSAS
jgi:hypothetical protein